MTTPTEPAGAKTGPTYGTYLRLDDLLGAQTTLTDAHDELQFIIVHQTFELWFKLMLFEAVAARAAMHAGRAAEAVHYLRRLNEIVKVLTTSFNVIETMRPYDFLEFRSELQPASGFQSVQFRELEFVCGVRDERYAKLVERPDQVARLRQRMAEPSVWDAYLELLRRHGLPTDDDPTIVKSIIVILKARDDHALGELTETLIEYDELFALWRQRHVRMAMRMIGAKPGTGAQTVKKLEEGGYGQFGPGGVDYLKSTLPKQFFPLLWEARTFIER
ncbi:MAG: tryptophan 2,3-dioxygenase family protein [Acidobacteriota bacterium]